MSRRRQIQRAVRSLTANNTPDEMIDQVEAWFASHLANSSNEDKAESFQIYSAIQQFLYRIRELG